jgi:hypothetical protein
MWRLEFLMRLLSNQLSDRRAGEESFTTYVGSTISAVYGREIDSVGDNLRQPAYFRFSQ